MQNSSSPSFNRFYTAYRKIRFLAKKGSLFALPSRERYANEKFPRGTFAIISVNSFFMFMLAYLIIYLLNLFVTGYTARLFDIRAVIYYFNVDFLIRGIDWTPDMVEGVFSAAPIAMLVLSIFLLILYFSVASETGILRLLVLWMIFHSLTRFFGELLVGSIMVKGFGFVILYLFIMDTAKVIISIFVFVVLFTLGLMLYQPYLLSANVYFNDLKKAYRLKFILHQFFYPFFLGNLAIFLIKIPEVSYFDTSLNFTGILMLIPFLVRTVSHQDLYFDEEPKTIKVRVVLMAVTIISIILFRIVFGIGVRL